jgi:MFS family permease
VVGGAVVGGISWHWIFWRNVPIGVPLIPLAVGRLTESYGPRPRLDIIGLVLVCAGLLGAWGLVRGNDAGWSSAEIITALVCGAVLVAAFAGWEARSSHPMLPLGLFRSRGFASANGVSFFMYAGLFGTLFLMAQFLQGALGDSPLHAGIAMLPWTSAPMVIAPIAGSLADRYGNRRSWSRALPRKRSGTAGWPRSPPPA